MKKRRRIHLNQKGPKPVRRDEPDHSSLVGGLKEDPLSTSNNPQSARFRVLFFVIISLSVLIAGTVIAIRARHKSTSSASGSHVAHDRRGLTFNQDIAPIIYRNCAICHRPDQSAPFSLITYQQVKKHAERIAEVTASRYMPPWLPEPGYVDYSNQRGLMREDVELIQRWVNEGKVEGEPGRLPHPPKWSEGWQLGQPDLIVRMPAAYTLPADGKDVYRNFVIPIPTTERRFVRAVELLPGNAKVLHHAFITVDETRQSRRIAEKTNPPGFDGMKLPQSAIMPGGQFLGWHPGQVPVPSPEGLAWVLQSNTDVVLQLHMHPSGKPEVIQPELGFYFTDRAPTNTTFRIRLCRYDIDVPPGVGNYEIEESYVLPVEVSLLRVSPHAHYLAKEMQGYAVLPTGERRWLLRIRQWDFNWQGDYEFLHPVVLPKGTRLVMHYSYDNTSNNVRNPNPTPKRVRFGLQTTDEMGELWFQVLPRNREDLANLSNDYLSFLNQENVDYGNYLLRLDPDDAQAHLRLGRTLHAQGKTRESRNHLLSALRIEPNNDQAHYELGYLYLHLNQLDDARREFLTVVRLNPDDYQAYGNLGFISMSAGRQQEARSFFEAAIRLNPDDSVAKRNLDVLNERGIR